MLGYGTAVLASAAATVAKAASFSPEDAYVAREAQVGTDKPLSLTG